MSKFIVTGGAGFIGSHITNTLLANGHEVVVIDDLSTGFLENLQSHENLTFVKADISNWVELVYKLSYLKNADGLFHLAAMARIQPAIQDPWKTHNINVNGTFNILEVCRVLDVKKIVYSSSSSCYGLKNEAPYTEDMPVDCLNPYSVSKHIGEKYIETWGKLYGIQTMSFRYFNVYGPRSPLSGCYAPVIGLFFRQTIKDNVPMTIIGDGKQTRDMTYIGDVVKANILAMEELNDQNSGQLLNIGTGESCSINELALKIQTLCKTKLGTQTLPTRPAEAKHAKADVSLAKRVLNWEPETPLDVGLSVMKNYYMDTLK